MASKDNLKHWSALAQTNPKHTSSFQRAGGFKGTAMKPIWIVQRMTEHFGPVGEGWGMTEPKFETAFVDDNSFVFCTVGVWHTKPEHIFYGVGGDQLIYKFKSGPRANDEAFKMAYTDAVNNALKYLGVGADIHMGQFDDSKYVHSVAAQFAAQDEEAAGQPSANEEASRLSRENLSKAVKSATNSDEIDSIVTEYKARIAAMTPADKAAAKQAVTKRRQELADA